MPDKSTKRDEGINSKRVVRCGTASLRVPALEQLTSTVVSSAPAPIPLFAPQSDKPVTRQDAQLFLDKLASVYLEQARIIVKTPKKTQMPRVDP